MCVCVCGGGGGGGRGGGGVYIEPPVFVYGATLHRASYVCVCVCVGGGALPSFLYTLTVENTASLCCQGRSPQGG